jgi:hypothetical protein
VCIAPDDFVFVAECGNNRVQVLTPTLDFHRFIGTGQLRGPVGVCANADVALVAEVDSDRSSVFNRRDGALLRRFGSSGDGDGKLSRPYGLCFVSGGRHVAVCDWNNHRVSVFSVDGEFIRHVGAGLFHYPRGVACSSFDELVVADTGNGRVVVLSDVGDVLTTFSARGANGVCLFGSALWVSRLAACTVFS